MEKQKNIYKNGRLERVYIASYDRDGEEAEIDTDNDSPALIYKYKKIKVPASYVKQVKRQQEWLTNKGSFQELPLAAY